MRHLILSLIAVIFCADSRAATEIHIEHVGTRDGPVSGSINTIIQDRTGYIWLGTSNGLLRYDGYSLKAFRHDPDIPGTISGNHIWSICEDRTGHLWIGTSGRGASRYVPAQNRFIHYAHDPADSTTLSHDLEVPFVYEDRDGNMWLATWEGGLDRYAPESGGFVRRDIVTVGADGVPRSNVHTIGQDRSGALWVGNRQGLCRIDPLSGRLAWYRADDGDPNSIGGNYVYAIVTDRDGRLWIGTSDGGLNRYRPATDDFEVFRYRAGDSSSLSSSSVSAVTVDSTGQLWVGTDGGGLCRFDPDTGRAVRIAETSRGSLAGETPYIASLYTDRQGIVWIGTAAAGLHRWHPTARKFIHVVAEPGVDGALQHPHVTAIHEASDGALWVGTGAAGLHRADAGSKSFESFRPGGEGDVSGSNIASIDEGADGTVWVGTYGAGLNRYDPQRREFGHFRHDDADPNSLVSDHVTAVEVDRNGRVWVGTDGSGISILDPATGTFENRTIDDEDPLHPFRHLWTIRETSDGSIWLGLWGLGANRFDPSTSKVDYFMHDDADPASISSNVVVVIEEDPSGDVWLGTWAEGLSRLDAKSGRARRYTTASGLPSDNVLGIVVDDAGMVWVATGDGLARYDTARDRWRVYGVRDGLQSSNFTRGAHHAGRSGRFYFGGLNGFNAFNPADVIDNSHVPSIVLTSLSIRGQEISSGLLSTAQASGMRLELSHGENALAFEFSALDYTHPAANQYAYKLEGVDDDWIQSGSRRVASYSHLSPGTYTLRVKGSNQDGVWNDDGLALGFVVTPPPWRTWWAYTLYVLVAAAIILALRQRELKRIRLAAELRMQRVEADQLRELDEAKSRFFANISHEFRTPLALILGPLERARSAKDAVVQRVDFDTMQRNARRLLRLIDQILDLSKVEAASMRLSVRDADLRHIARVCVASFESYAESHGLQLNVEAGDEPVLVSVDREQIEKCVNNLLSNAIKFTPSGGRVDVNVTSRNGAGDVRRAVLQVSDTGAGITDEDARQIFDRYFQSAATDTSQGTGIGLALTKELVTLHGGEVTVSSGFGVGATFTIELPQVSADEAELMPEPPLLDDEDPPGGSDSAPLVLVIEDTADMRRYVRTVLAEGARVIEAPDGERGIEVCLEHMPELVVCDLMMPGIDGFEVCRRLKSDSRTSHIPFVMLTARAGEESRVEGLETGADDYVAKPFSAAELRARVRNLVRSRRELQERFRREVSLMPKDVVITPVDANFVEHLMEIVNDNIDNPDFSVEAFADAVGMSRMHLHRKIRALTGQSAGEFVRTVRLRLAARMLAAGDHSVTEVAYAVGFRTPAYFSKCFRDEFGVTPSDYAASPEK